MKIVKMSWQLLKLLPYCVFTCLVIAGVFVFVWPVSLAKGLSLSQLNKTLLTGWRRRKALAQLLKGHSFILITKDTPVAIIHKVHTNHATELDVADQLVTVADHLIDAEESVELLTRELGIKRPQAIS